MSTKGGLIFLITSIILVLGCIVALIGIYYFDWLKPANSGYTVYTATPDNDARFVVKDDEPTIADPSHDAVLGNVVTENNIPKNNNAAAETTTETAETTTTISVGNPEKKYTYLNYSEPHHSANETVQNKNNTVAKSEIHPKTTQANTAAKTTVATKTESQPKTAQTQPNAPQKPSSPARTVSGNPVPPRSNMPAPRFTKTDSVPTVKSVPVGKDGSPIKIGFTFDKNRDFHSYGQYVSADEYKYRLAVINNLKIKTIVIDAVSQGNGISQEYYKVAYNANMIPAKILDEVVTSKEFRALIPKQYLDIEEKMTAFPKGGKVTFNNTDMKELLILWSQGKLTPTQKAWQVKAAM